MPTHHPDTTLLALMHDRYTYAELCVLAEYLTTQKVFSFTPLSSGLYPASPSTAELGRYRFAWMRDNACIARTFVVRNLEPQAVGIARALLRYASLHTNRYDFVTTHRSDDGDVMNRPHVRWNGETLTELEEPWAHAQNDAHGHVLSLLADLMHSAALSWDEVREYVTQTVRMFEALSVSTDADSGVWEETRALRASSLGVVFAGLRDMQPHVAKHDSALAAAMAQLGAATHHALMSLLPRETADRADDSALLFLVEPCTVVNSSAAVALIARLTASLGGEYGMCRYRGDTFWGPDYLTHGTQERTSLVDMFSFRSAPIDEGQEAQWTLFDPLIATFYAKQCLTHFDEALFDRATYHLNRSLRCLVRDDEQLSMPELFYREQGERTPNTIRPLYWAQANLSLALTILMRVARAA